MPWKQCAKQCAKCNENNDYKKKKEKERRHLPGCCFHRKMSNISASFSSSLSLYIYSIVHFKSMVDVKIKLHAKPTYVPCTRTCIYLTIRYTQIIYLCNIQPNKTVLTKKKYLEIFGTKQSYTKRKMHPRTNDSLGTGTRRQPKEQLREAYRRTSITMRYSAGI